MDTNNPNSSNTNESENQNFLDNTVNRPPHQNPATRPPQQYLDTRSSQQNIRAPQNIAPLYPIISSLSGWMKFIGIITIISGSITCLGIITAALGIPIIFSGIALVKASKSVSQFGQYNNPYLLNDTFLSINKYFKIKSIITLVGISLFVLYMVVLLFIFTFTVSNSWNY